MSKIYEKYRVSHSQVKVQLAIPTFTLEGEVGAWSWQYYSLPSKFWTWGASTTKWTLAILFVLFASPLVVSGGDIREDSFIS